MRGMSKEGKSFFKPLPFKLDRRLMVNFADQLVEGVRRSVESGYYRPGDVLPPQKEIARLLDVSIRIPREAYRKLADQRIASPRKSVGCVILPRGANIWKGRVLFVTSAASEGAYFLSKMLGTIRRKLAAEGWLFNVVNVDVRKYGARDTAALESELAIPYDLAVVYCLTEKYIVRMIEKQGVPAMMVNDVPPSGGKPKINVIDGAVRSFVAQCRAGGVKKVLLAEYWPIDGLESGIRKAGLKVEKLIVRPRSSECYLEDIERQAFSEFCDRFAKGRKRPDLVLCSDDYIARGALMAFATGALRIPEDVKFVTWANKGHIPVAPFSLARFESDPRTSGEAFAACILARLRGEDPCSVPPDEIDYVCGDSFPSA